MTKNKKKNNKIVGYISDKVSNAFDLKKYINKEITQSTKLDIHTNKHANDFFSIDSYHNTLINIDKILANSYHVEYDSNKKSLKYYGNID